MKFTCHVSRVTCHDRRTQSGRSMIEMLGVLAIMGVITVGAVAMISAAMRSQKRTNVQDQVAQIVTGVRGLLGQYDDYTGIDNNTIFAAIGVTSKNPYNGNYTLAVDPTNPQQFILSIDGLNQSECQYFKAKAWGDSVGFQTSDGKTGGAVANPTDCSADAGKNTINITFN